MTRLAAAGLTMVIFGIAACQPQHEAGFAGAVEIDWESARRRMVEQQLKAPGRDITNQRVLQAMAVVPRHEFVPEDWRERAYDRREGEKEFQESEKYCHH